MTRREREFWERAFLALCQGPNHVDQAAACATIALYRWRSAGCKPSRAPADVLDPVEMTRGEWVRGCIPAIKANRERTGRSLFDSKAAWDRAVARWGQP
jgi:hypothetical protein